MTAPRVSLLESTIEEEDTKRIYGVVTATVASFLDPFTLGRIQVRFAGIDGLDMLAYARLALPMAGFLHGTYFVPDIGEQVLVAFENGDVNSPFILGSLWHALAPPPIATPILETRAIRTVTGNQVVFDEKTSSVSIQSAPAPPEVLPAPPSPVGPYSTVMVTPAFVQTTSPSVQAIAGTSVVLSAGGAATITMTSGSIVLQCGSSVIALTPAGIVIRGAMVAIN